jgi:alkylation response protein AidB-like acyl-CoA dehydrogenase
MTRDYTLNEDQDQIRQLAREFAEGELRPRAVRWDRAAEFHSEVLPQLGELGFFGMILPEEYDGSCPRSMTASGSICSAT